MEISVSNQDFIEWLSLDLQACSWEGRHLSQFSDFWNGIFSLDDPQVIHKKISGTLSNLRKGPLHSWLCWVNESYIVYLFLYKDISVSELASIFEKDASSVLILIWDFLIQKNIGHEAYLSETLLLSGVDLLNCDLKFKSLSVSDELNIESNEELLSKLEITLLPEWKKVSAPTEKKNKSLEKKSSTPRLRLKFLQEVVFLFVFGALFIFSVKVGNAWYQDHLINKISLFSPDFFWLDKNVSFLSEDSLENAKKDVTFENFNELEQVEPEDKLEINDEFRRFEVESDVVLTSIDSLPKDFNIADFERSSYEEVKKGGYRNNRWGRRRAYRVMLTSADISSLKSKLTRYLSEYNVSQADNVKPGTMVPGGAYYNLYVPRKHLRQFLSLLSEEKDAVILESKTIHSGPKDRDKIFIWVKTI